MEENQGPLPSSKHSHTNLFQKAVVQKFLRPHNELLPLQTHPVSYTHLDVYKRQVQAAFFEPATVALHGIKCADYHGGEDVAILGGGTVGLFTMQWAKILGARRVVVFDISDTRLELAKKLGAEMCIRDRFSTLQFLPHFILLLKKLVNSANQIIIVIVKLANFVFPVIGNSYVGIPFPDFFHSFCQTGYPHSNGCLLYTSPPFFKTAHNLRLCVLQSS